MKYELLSHFTDAESKTQVIQQLPEASGTLRNRREGSNLIASKASFHSTVSATPWTHYRIYLENDQWKRDISLPSFAKEGSIIGDAQPALF